MEPSEESVTVGPFVLQGASQRQIGILSRITPTLDENLIDQYLIPLITQQSTISLRALDWLVTNFSKKNNIICKTTNHQMFNIYHGYKIALSHFRRRNFDPFRRRSRILLRHKDTLYETTVGQCNFIYWAYQHGVLQYAIEHAYAIEKDMNTATVQNKSERKLQLEKGIPHRRRELSKAPTAKCSVYKVESKVSFTNFESDCNKQV